MTKICSKCKQEKPLEEFDNKKAAKDGKRSQCKECRRLERERNKEKINAKRRDIYAQIKDLPETKEKIRNSYLRNKEQKKIYRKENREKINEWKRQDYYKNRKTILERVKFLRHSNPEEYKERRAKIQAKNPEYYKNYSKEYTKRRRREDNNFRIAGNLRNRINKVVKEHSNSSQELLGCSIEEYIQHIESQFQLGMNWENYGTYWNIDHILPCCSFDLTDPEQQKRCFNWQNCRPLTVEENSRKGNTDDLKIHKNRLKLDKSSVSTATQ